MAEPLRSPKLEILDLITDDSYGLWEIAGWLTDRVPEGTKVRVVAVRELAEMLSEGLVDLLHRNSLDSPERVMETDEALERLAMDGSWEVPRPGVDGDQVRAVATDHGLDYYTARWQPRSA